MSPYKNKFFITFFLFSLSLNAQYEININYESGFEYQSQVILAKNLQNELSKKGIVNLIKKEDWIDNYSIVFQPFEKKVFINIKNKNPLFVLNSEYFYDKELTRFKYDQSSNNHIKVNGDISEVENILFIIELVESNKLMDLKIDRIEYSFVNGWDVKTKSILTTTPFFKPLDGYEPKATISNFFSSLYLPTIQTTLEVPISKPTIILGFLLLFAIT